MALKYHVVGRADIRKGAPKGAKMYYGQIHAGEQISFRSLCDSICAHSTTFRGDVPVIIKELLHIMQLHLMNGLTVHLDGFGSFRMIAGSRGVEDAARFHPMSVRKKKRYFVELIKRC